MKLEVMTCRSLLRHDVTPLMDAPELEQLPQISPTHQLPQPLSAQPLQLSFETCL